MSTCRNIPYLLWTRLHDFGEYRRSGHFGSGCLLDDLIQFVYSGEGCRLMLVGDTAQLLPWGRNSVRPSRDAHWKDMACMYGKEN